MRYKLTRLKSAATVLATATIRILERKGRYVRADATLITAAVRRFALAILEESKRRTEEESCHSPARR